MSARVAPARRSSHLTGRGLVATAIGYVLNHEQALRLVDIKAPVLLMWGDRDRWIPIEFARRLESGIAGAKLVHYPDGGHVPMEDLLVETARDVDAFLQ